MQTLDTPHTRLGATYLSVGILLALLLWAADVSPLVISVVVGGFLVIILVGMASGLIFGNVEGA